MINNNMSQADVRPNLKAGGLGKPGTAAFLHIYIYIYIYTYIHTCLIRTNIYIYIRIIYIYIYMYRIRVASNRESGTILH